MFIWPTFKRELLTRVFEATGAAWPWWLRRHRRSSGCQTELVVEDYWATFPEWYIAVPFLLVCGFATVYFLGAKAFCTYACPYGGLFGLVEPASPTRVRVDHDKCGECGHCTAACTSNVRVHEEIKAFGMVVDAGCMKTMDCISVCPNDALSIGLGRPAIGAGVRGGARVVRQGEGQTPLRPEPGRRGRGRARVRRPVRGDARHASTACPCSWRAGSRSSARGSPCCSGRCSSRPTRASTG
jgi:NAD-dependent dihydropyrimidine dehydrogenase PreA subunit